MMTVVSLVQPLNALSAMDDPPVITTVRRLVFGMKEIAAVGIETSVSAEQSENASVPTLETLPGTVSESSEEQPENA